ISVLLLFDERPDQRSGARDSSDREGQHEPHTVKIPFKAFPHDASPCLVKCQIVPSSNQRCTATATGIGSLSSALRASACSTYAVANSCGSSMSTWLSRSRIIVAVIGCLLYRTFFRAAFRVVFRALYLAVRSNFLRRPLLPLLLIGTVPRMEGSG